MKVLLALVGLCLVLCTLGSTAYASFPSSTSTASAAPTLGPAASHAPTSQPKPSTHTRVVRLPPTTLRDGTVSLHVRFSAPVYRGSAVPSLTPGVAGRWRISGDEEIFTPKSTLEPCSTYTLTVWGRTVSTAHLPLGKRVARTLSVACPSTLALQQALARLRYLPYELRSHRRADADNRRESPGEAARYAFRPPRGPFVAYIAHAPGLRYASLDPTTRGALMVFQVSSGLAPTGVADRDTWIRLLADESRARQDPRPYTFVTVSEQLPETLRVYEGHHLVLSSPTNTGVAGAQTEQGTFPIYARYVATTMSGTNPDGSHYSDPGVPWVNYFNAGDAVHGFPRPSYGTPQSNGCVELPIGTAAQIYPLLSIGDLVIVS